MPSCQRLWLGAPRDGRWGRSTGGDRAHASAGKGSGAAQGLCQAQVRPRPTERRSRLPQRIGPMTERRTHGAPQLGIHRKGTAHVPLRGPEGRMVLPQAYGLDLCGAHIPHPRDFSRRFHAKAWNPLEGHPRLRSKREAREVSLMRSLNSGVATGAGHHRAGAHRVRPSKIRPAKTSSAEVARFARAQRRTPLAGEAETRAGIPCLGTRPGGLAERPPPPREAQGRGPLRLYRG